MAELNSHVYVKKIDSSKAELLGTIIQAFSNNDLTADAIESNFVSAAKAFDEEQGENLAIKLLASVKKSYGDTARDLYANIHEIAGYYRLHFCHGSVGDELIPSIVSFLGDLIPNSDVRAYLHGDDDPWEIFYVYETSRVVEKDYGPDQSERDNDQLPDEYLWWHSGMPKEILEGFINTWKAVDDDEWEDWL